jgi:predicted esterase
MSLFTGSSSPHKLAGIVGLSSYMVLKDSVKKLIDEDGVNGETPIFMGHGKADPLVKYAWGEATRDLLKGFGFNVDFNGYEGLQHSAAPEEIVDVENFLSKVLPPVGDLNQTETGEGSKGAL